MTVLLSKTFFVWFRVALGNLLESHMAQDTHRSFADTSVCILQACTYIAIWCASTRDNKTHVPYDCTLHTK